jgi:hypothetical protein
MGSNSSKILNNPIYKSDNEYHMFNNDVSDITVELDFYMNTDNYTKYSDISKIDNKIRSISTFMKHIFLVMGQYKQFSIFKGIKLHDKDPTKIYIKVNDFKIIKDNDGKKMLDLYYQK